MPSVTTHTPPSSCSPSRSGITKFTNCLLIKGDRLIQDDLWFSSVTGKILHSQEVFFGQRAVPDQVIDLDGKIVAPGFIDVQLNGAFSCDFSVVPEDMAAYAKGVKRVNKKLIRTGVTSYLPTLISQRSEVYHQTLPYLGPSGTSRNPQDGAESLGAHLEGPFISPTKNGIHDPHLLQEAGPDGFATLSAFYGGPNALANAKIITLAPELPGALDCIASLTAASNPNRLIASIGHSEATYEEALAGITAGATMITHLFNAMRPLHHRNPGIFGLLGTETFPPAPSTASASAASSPPSTPSSSTPAPPFQPLQPLQKPYFGIIADGIHLHPTTVKIAATAHPAGLVLVTDAMALAGLPDGDYDWSRGNKTADAGGSRIRKRGPLLTQLETGRIAGSSIALVECVSNFLNWTGVAVPHAVRAVTETPARLLGLDGVKGCLDPDADADLVILDLQRVHGGWRKLEVEQVWKFGSCMFKKGQEIGVDNEILE